MSGKVTQFMKTQKYRFDFGTDEKLHIVIFNANIPQAQLKGLLSSLHNCLFEKIPNVIFSFLKLHHLEFSNLNSIEIPLDYYNAMEWAGYLLHSDSYSKVDENLENADIYYAVMDYQNITPDGNKEGCYFTVRRAAWGNGEFEHNAIAQSYFCKKETCEEYGYFAIRKTTGNTLYTIDSSEEAPVLPAFGCIDLISLLSNIENIQTKEDVLKTAVK